MPEPLISVVTPVFRGAEFLAAALDSLDAQTLQADEWVFVIEDGADPAMVDALERRVDARFSLIRNHRLLGLSASLNIGVRAARGEFVARMDSDDICRPTRFERQVALLRSDPSLDLVSSWCQLFGDEDWLFKPARDHGQIRIDLLTGCPFVHPSVMFRRARFLETGLAYDETLEATEDYDLWSRAGERMRFGVVPEILLDYRKHAAAATHARARSGARTYKAVMERELSRLCPPSPAELDLHYRAFTGAVLTAPELEALRLWFERLTRVNRTLGLHDQDRFARTFAQRYFEILSRTDGPEAERAFRDSELFQALDPQIRGSVLTRGAGSRAPKGLARGAKVLLRRLGSLGPAAILYWLRLLADRRLVEKSPLFDRDWYLSASPDLAARGGDPVLHYLRWGAAEGRNPGPDFDTAAYLARNADVRERGVNPLVHYLRSGQKEGRSPKGD